MASPPENSGQCSVLSEHVRGAAVERLSSEDQLVDSVSRPNANPAANTLEFGMDSPAKQYLFLSDH
jgi:hypothetical protein